MMTRRAARSLMLATAVAAMLAGCNKAGNSSQSNNQMAALPPLPGAVPLQAGAATPIHNAPSGGALPTAGPVREAALAAPDAGYAYLDRAAGFSGALGNAPPDYAFDYDGVSPWAWQADDGAVEYAEPIDDGYRSYYYEPGADAPYLIRTPDFSYAYAAGALVAIYAATGAFLPRDRWGSHADFGWRFYHRGDGLWRAAHDGDHRGVIAANWAARRSALEAQHAAWSADQARDAAWRSYHDAHAAEVQAHWADDSAQRAAAATRFTEWQRHDFQGPPPQFRQAVARPVPVAHSMPIKYQPGPASNAYPAPPPQAPRQDAHQSTPGQRTPPPSFHQPRHGQQLDTHRLPTQTERASRRGPEGQHLDAAPHFAVAPHQDMPHDQPSHPASQETSVAHWGAPKVASRPARNEPRHEVSHAPAPATQREAAGPTARPEAPHQTPAPRAEPPHPQPAPHPTPSAPRGDGGEHHH